MGIDSESGETSCEDINDLSVKNTKFSVFEDDTEKNNKLKYTCIIDGCMSSFNRPWRLKNHLKVHHLGERPFKCTTPGCDKSYTNNAHLRRHVLITHLGAVNRTKINCTEPGCTDQFSTKQNLQKHIQRFHTQHFICTYCNMTFAKHMHLKSHLNSHIQTNGAKCLHCDEFFYSLKSLQRHQNRHKIYLCPEETCNELFMKWTLLRKHIADKHKPEFSCPTCNLKFKDFSRFKEHYKSHLTVNQFCCDFPNCNREFKYKRNLIQHQVVQHLGERFSCEKCNKSFTSRQRLKLHYQKPSCDAVKPRRPPPRGEARRRRKDAGIPRKALALDLSGYQADHQTHKQLLKNDIQEASISTDEVKEVINQEEEGKKEESETSREDNDIFSDKEENLEKVEISEGEEDEERDISSELEENEKMDEETCEVKEMDNSPSENESQEEHKKK